MLSFFSSRRNWDSPIPSPAGECAPPPPLVLSLGHTHLRERGWGSPNSYEGTCTAVLYLYTYVQYFVVCTISRWLEIYCACTCTRWPRFDLLCLDVGSVVCVKKISSQITQSFKGTVCVCILSNCDTPSSVSGRDCCHAN